MANSGFPNGAGTGGRNSFESETTLLANSNANSEPDSGFFSSDFRNLDKNNNGHGQRGQTISTTGESTIHQQQSGTNDASELENRSKSSLINDNSTPGGSKNLRMDPGLHDSVENFITSPSEGPARCAIVAPETFLVDVIVSNAVSPLNFSIQSYRESNILKNLENQMTIWYNDYEKSQKRPPLQFKDLTLDNFYAVKYRIGDQKTGVESWVRCQIKKPFVENLPILTHLIDRGCYYSTEPKNILPLRKQYCQMPCQSFDAKLHFVESTKSSFTPEDCHRFHNQVEGKPFCAIVLKTFSTEKDNKLTVILVDTSTEKDHYIHHDYVSSKKSSVWQ